jgi:hypothetical protein
MLYSLRDLDRAFRTAVDEIIDDIETGTLPPEVKTFAELHNYVDANEYGGLCDVVGTVSQDELEDYGNALQSRLDQWLSNGRREHPPT